MGTSISGSGANGLVTVHVGDTVTFLRPDGVTVSDVVRATFLADLLLAPYAPNRSVPAVVLTAHSWTALSTILTVSR